MSSHRNQLANQLVANLFIYLNISGRAQATYMPVKINYSEHIHVRQWNKIKRLYNRESYSYTMEI